MFPFRNLVNIIPLNKKTYIKVLDKILNIKEQSSFIPYNKNMNYKIKLKQKKYLFLDIDGVLNSFDDYNMTGNEFIKNLKNISFVTSKKQMSILNKIVEEYNPTIILSSYWRTRYSLEELNNIFRENIPLKRKVGRPRRTVEQQNEFLKRNKERVARTRKEAKEK